MDLSWMQWTPATALVLGVLFVVLALMTVWDIRSPSIRRKGFLPIGFTRGERLFLSIVIFIGTMICWLAFLPKTDPLFALPAAAILILIVVRWG
jgi:predicted small integral membrane protein